MQIIQPTERLQRRNSVQPPESSLAVMLLRLRMQNAEWWKNCGKQGMTVELLIKKKLGKVIHSYSMYTWVYRAL